MTLPKQRTNIRTLVTEARTEAVADILRPHRYEGWGGPSWWEYQRRGTTATKPRSQAWSAVTKHFVSKEMECNYSFCDDKVIMQGEVCYLVKGHGLWHLQCLMKDTIRAFEQAERERRNRICPECKKGYLAPHRTFGDWPTPDKVSVSCGNCKHGFEVESGWNWVWEVT